MKYFTSAVALLSVVSAAPYEIVGKRKIDATDIEERGGSSCPRDLPSGQYEFPHYITQISKQYPDKSYGMQYNGVFTPDDVSSVFLFDIPASRKDANCQVEFLFPKQEQLQTSSYSYSGHGTFYFKFYQAGSCPNEHTTYNHQPSWGNYAELPALHLEPGYAYTIDVGSCAPFAGTCMAGAMWSPDTSLTYFQDYNPCPIGLYNIYSYGTQEQGWTGWSGY